MEKVTFNYQFTLREWQREAISKMKRFSVLAVHRRAGKTTLAINGVLIPKALDKSGLYAYIAPELKQAKLIAWKALKQSCMQFLGIGADKTNLVEFRESELMVRFWNKSEIRLLGADNPDSLRGSKLAGAVIDEVAQMPKELWHEIVYPALMDSKGFALFIGTPKGVNLFSELFDKGNDDNFSNWQSLRFTCFETDALDREDIETYHKSVPEEVFKREMLCDFTASANNQLVSLQQVEQSSHKTIDEHFLGRVDLVMGVDVARFGADRSVICLRRGLLAYEPIIFHGLSLVDLASVVKRVFMEQSPKVVNIDGTGVGGGLVDILNNWGIWCNDINFGHKSIDAQYINKRTEMWCKLADWIGKGGVIPNNADLIAEIAMPTFDINEKNQKVLESKRQIRDRLGKSPDIADALALTFAEELPQTEIDDPLERLINSQRQQADNPFKRYEERILHGNRRTFFR